jgi:hypothetical protein
VVHNDQRSGDISLNKNSIVRHMLIKDPWPYHFDNFPDRVANWAGFRGTYLSRLLGRNGASDNNMRTLTAKRI